MLPRRLNHSLQFHAFVDAQKPNKMSFDLVLIVRDALRVDIIDDSLRDTAYNSSSPSIRLLYFKVRAFCEV